MNRLYKLIFPDSIDVFPKHECHLVDEIVQSYFSIKDLFDKSGCKVEFYVATPSSPNFVFEE